MSKVLPDIPGYEVEAEIGRGGMGVVYRVRQRSSGSVLALKMLLQGRTATLADLARFRIEAEALACLDHPNIIGIRDVGVYAGYPYFSLPYAGRGNLRQKIAQGLPHPMWSVGLLRTLALAMQHAHERGMLHRDLKPANILLMEDGTPVVTDFGLVKFAHPLRSISMSYATISVSVLDTELTRFARELAAQFGEEFPIHSDDDDGDPPTQSYWEQCADRTGMLHDEEKLESIKRFLSEARREELEGASPDLDALTRDGSVMGSPCYMAPEQAAADFKRIGPRTDVYGLGAILYEMLTGSPPFRSDTWMTLHVLIRTTPPAPPRQIVPAIARDIETVCLKCLAKSPEDRYESAAELANDLTRVIDGYSPRAVPVEGPSQTPGPAPANKSSLTITKPTPPIEPRAPSTRNWWPFAKSRKDRKPEGQGDN